VIEQAIERSLTRSMVDQAGERVRKREARPDDRHVLQAYRRVRACTLPVLHARTTGPIEDLIVVASCRVKRVDTMVRKLIREPTMNASRMVDVIGFRIITPSPEVQSEVAKRLQAEQPEDGGHKRRVLDYVGRPAESGYRGIHLIIPDIVRRPWSDAAYSYPVEVQIRTYLQHLWATESESYGEQVKEGGGSAATREYLLQLSERLEEYERDHPVRVQTELVASEDPLQLTLIQFDKRSGRQVLLEHYTDLGLAVEQLVYLEDMFSEDQAVESVLLSSNSIGTTHLRYFRPWGRPEIDARFMEGLIRPSVRR
jgi:hypothetical protein